VVVVAVRDLVDWVMRAGDLESGEGWISPRRALEGARAHRRLQRSRPADYQAEVSLVRETVVGDIVLRVQGRADGVLIRPDGVILEEIKTVAGGLEPAPDPLHWAQAKIYAAMYVAEHGLDHIEIQLTYIHIESGETAVFRQSFPAAELAELFAKAVVEYAEWERDRLQWGRLRDGSIATLPFPHSRYRPGQRALAVAVFRTLEKSGRLFAEAPTGIGKTISVLYPALKALGRGHVGRLFYLTAKTVGRTLAEKAIADLRASGLRLRSLTLTAREKICFKPDQPCDPRTCPFAHGYYDRIRDAVREAVAGETLTRPAVEAAARRHQVCPFELSLEVSLWVDAIIGDYNYVFDPQACLKRHFAEGPTDFAFLVDEAHNLVDRGREMFSAELDLEEIRQVRRMVRQPLPGCARALDQVCKAFRAWRANASAGASDAAPGPLAWATPDYPAELPADLRRFLEAAEASLAQDRASTFREPLRELYFRTLDFLRILEIYDDRYVTLTEARGQQMRLRLFCLDPSARIREALDRGKSAVFFSATLSPMDYFRKTIGGDGQDACMRLPSPFAQGHLGVLIADHVRTEYRHRARSEDDVAAAIASFVTARPGNYLVYFPSYQYLDQVRKRFELATSGIPIRCQSPGMAETEREAFLALFDSPHPQGQVGFAVMGGLFGEAIDLAGDRLIGVAVVGVGLPQVGLERDAIRAYFQRTNRAGFDFAYRFPGLNRVLQAAGRLIRSETDRGLVLLIDARFAEEKYRRLLPSWWSPIPVHSASEIDCQARRFWEDAAP